MLNRVFGPFDTQGFQISRAQVYSFPLDLTGDDEIDMIVFLSISVHLRQLVTYY